MIGVGLGIMIFGISCSPAPRQPARARLSFPGAAAYARPVSSEPVTPYAPDPDEGAPDPVELGDLVDVVAKDLDWAGQRAPGLSARRVELRRCRLYRGGAR